MFLGGKVLENIGRSGEITHAPQDDLPNDEYFRVCNYTLVFHFLG